jgi:hypothetical protein
MSKGFIDVINNSLHHDVFGFNWLACHSGVNQRLLFSLELGGPNMAVI